MLQWMGGSRRKVTASRKSTQKRQQQFFEQRKRQQQQQEVANDESHNNGPVTYSHQKGNRSLDILSLLNVPKVAEERKPACGSESISIVTDRAPRERSFEAVATKDHFSSKRSPLVVTSEVPAADFVEVEPTRTSTQSNFVQENVSLKGSWKNTSTARNAESKCWRIDSSNQTSILDIIGDDGPSVTSEGKPAHEAHVAFSVEGLGNIGTETPKQSPQQPARMCYGDQSSNSKAAKKLQFRENLNCMLDELEMEVECYMQDTKEPICGNRRDSFLISEDLISPLSYTEHKLSPAKAAKKFGAKRWEMDSLHVERDTNFWNAGSPFLDDDISNKKCGMNWKKDDANTLCDVSPDFEFKEPHLLPRSQKDISGRYDDLDEEDRRFCSPEDPKYSSFMRDYKPQATRLSPYGEMEHRRNNLTSLSEESCSSSAARGWNVADMPSERYQRSCGDDLPWQLNSNTEENLQEEMQDIMTGTMRQGVECDRSKKYRRSNSGHTRSAYISQAMVNEKHCLEDSWLLEEEFPLRNTDRNSGPFFPSSWENRHKTQRSDPFGTTNVQANLRTSSKSHFGAFENKSMDELSPENIPSFPPFRPRKSFNTSFSTGGSYRESSRDVRQDLNIPVRSSNSVDVTDYFGETETAFPVPELSAQGSVTEEVGDKLESNREKITQISAQNLNISQESKSTAVETNIKESGSSFRKENSDIHEKIITNSSEEDAEETSSPFMIQHESDGELDTKELQWNIPGLRQQDLKVAVAEVGCFMTKPVNNVNLRGFRAKTASTEPSCQVMTVERYVLQLFCVSKGKGAMWDTAQTLS